MVARRPKLIAAGLVLGAGVTLAWPLRRDEPLPSSRMGVAAPATPTGAVAKPILHESHAAKPVVHDPANGLNPPARSPDRDPFANVPPPAAGTEADEPQVFNTISSGVPSPPLSTAPAQSTHRIHVVHEGDSLNRLAKRYLGDDARALEIFDLNREVLDNPHLLPLGTELKIPLSAGASSN
ncbi:MAG TPA: LysM peptidoglycan-binding domain-containing protein [Lacipirellula sp.]